MTSLSRTGWLSIAAALMSLLAISPCMAQTHEFNVPAQSATTGIPEFARQAGIQILVAEKAVRGQRTAAVIGTFSVQDGLATLIAGTRLVLGRVDSQSITLLSALPNADPAKSAVSPDAKEASGTPGPPIAPTGAANDQHRSSLSNEAGPNRVEQLEEVLVTGSRIPRTTKEGPQEVKVYTRQQIEQSGQTTVADFVSTLPSASVAINENVTQTFGGATTVQLHGLPVGTTLVLLNGRRVEASGSQVSSNFFDLNSIPLSAVQRIEIASEGSSAIYGSDAIAGVVNIILKSEFDGFESNVKYGGASGTDDISADLALGKRWESGSASIIATYQTRSELSGSERSITAGNDYRAFGGIDARSFNCNPGNVFFPNGFSFAGKPPVQYAAVPAGSVNQPTLQEFAGTAGTLNECSLNAYESFIPATHRAGMLASGKYNLSPSVEVFSELLFSHTQELLAGIPAQLFGVPGFQLFNVPASNPYNPFGQTVGISGLLTTLGRTTQPLDTYFLRPLVGARGEFAGNWKWEVSAWQSRDRSDHTQTNDFNIAAIQAALNSTSPATALNPFVDGAQGSPELLRSLVSSQSQHFMGQTEAVNGFLHGTLLTLPAGPVEIVVGGEIDRDTIDVPSVLQTASHRNTHAIFGEARVPLLSANSKPPSGDVLAVTVAGRYDKYSDFGSKTTPQFGVEFRPLEGLLVRGTYARAFKAPSLFNLNSPQISFPSIVIDPLRGNQTDTANLIFGGNPGLKAETGQSRTIGFVYSSQKLPALKLSVTHWSIDENNSIQSLDPQSIVNNESLFPSDVVRAAQCSGGPPCPITQVNSTYVNYGMINVKGVDIQVAYKATTKLGELSAALSATETYQYLTALQPGSSPVDRVSIANDDGNFAPRWKGTVMLGWKRGQLSVNSSGRYVGRYQDYDSTNEIGNVWLFDANVHYTINEGGSFVNRWLANSYVEIGGINLSNRLPQFSNYGFGAIGYDPAEADLRGRFLYARVGIKWQ